MSLSPETQAWERESFPFNERIARDTGWTYVGYLGSAELWRSPTQSDYKVTGFPGSQTARKLS